MWSAFYIGLFFMMIWFVSIPLGIMAYNICEGNYEKERERKKEKRRREQEFQRWRLH